MIPIVMLSDATSPQLHGAFNINACLSNWTSFMGDPILKQSKGLNPSVQPRGGCSEI